MDVFDLSAKLKLDSSDYDRSLQNASSSAEKWATKFAMATKAIGGAISAVSKQIVGLTKQAVDSFSNFQQLKGGIETLYGTQGKEFEEWAKTYKQSSDAMQDYVDIARKVINGDFGVGAERRDLLAQAGYDPNTIQQIVNDLINGIDVSSGVASNTVATNVQSAEEKYASLQRAEAKAMENAKAAWSTAGISANEYMQMSTAFAASLVSSLGGDTEKAVDIADMAIRDMSDNANKMGTDISSIQMAYQGFAKQNYTMLDNLKLGYGGTKTEMERLLADAEKLTGVHYDINNLSDVYQAINAIQKELGITGTTADEAATTIQGSANAMNAAWSNMLTSLVTGGEFFDDSLDALIESVDTFIKNVTPAIEGALRGISTMISSLVPVIVEMLPGLVETLLPNILDAIASVIDSILTALPDLLTALTSVIPMVVDALVDLVPTLVSSITACAGQLLDAGVTLLESLIDGLANNVDTIIPSLTQAVVDIAQKLTEIITNDSTNISTSALALIKNLADELLKAIPTLLESLPEIITSLVTWLTDPNNLVEMGSAALDIFGAIVSDVPAIIASMVTCLTEIITGIADHFRNNGGDMVQGIVDGFGKLKEKAQTIWEDQIKPAFDELGEFFKSFFLQFEWGETFLNFVKNIGDKIKELWDSVKSAFDGEDGFWGKLKSWFAEFDLTDVITGLIDSIKSAFATGWDNLKSVFDGEDGFFGKVKGWFYGLDLTTVVNALLDGLKSAFTSGWDTLKSIIDGADGFLEKIKGWFKDLSLTDAANSFISALKKGINEAWDGVKTWFQGLFKNIFDNIELPGWVMKAIELLGFGKNKSSSGSETEVEGTPVEGEEGEEGSIDMPSNMVTLDYNNLEPIPEDVIASYQALATAIEAINKAITGGGGEGEEGAEMGETGEGAIGLQAALSELPALFDAILGSAELLAAYFAGDFLTAIQELLKALYIGGSEDKKTGKKQGGGNTLANALGEIKGLFESILGTTDSLIGIWKGAFIEAINVLKSAIGDAVGTVEDFTTKGQSMASAYQAAAAAVLALVAALKELAGMSGGGDGGAGGTGGGFVGAAAKGAEVNAGETFMVGENGPELFTAARSGTIIPNNKLGGNVTINLTFAGDVFGDEQSISDYVTTATRRVIEEEVFASA